MKRYLPLSMVILFPYIIIGLPVFSGVTGIGAEMVFAGEGAMLLALWFLLYVIALLCSLIVLIVSLIAKRNSQEMLHTSMVVKLVHLPAYILIFVAALLYLIWAAPGFTILIFALGFMIAFLSGLIGLGVLIRSFCEKRISIGTAIVHGILQFVFLADIISSVFLYRKIERTTQDNA